MLKFLRRWDTIIGTVGSLVLILGAWFQWLPLDMTEVLGFVTGAIGVWLTVKENIWNWPIGIANSAFYVVVFFSAQLYADMSLQVVYIVLGILGWYWWLHGGKNKSQLIIARLNLTTLLASLLIAAISTFALNLLLVATDDAAPFLDALTTVMSLIAQYYLTRKLLENWHVWIAVDVIYISLYAYKGLYLTSALYVLFMTMCVVGLVGWRKATATAKPANIIKEARLAPSEIADWKEAEANG